MFEKLHRMFWRALTPDLVPDQVKVAAPSDNALAVQPEVIAALGGLNNLKSRQRVALTRLRVELHDAAQMDRTALSAAGVAGVMTLSEGVFHLLVGLETADAQ